MSDEPDEALVERCAQAAYAATKLSGVTWAELPESFRAIQRVEARAVLAEAGRPAPDKDHEPLARRLSRSGSSGYVKVMTDESYGYYGPDPFLHPPTNMAKGVEDA